MDGAGRVPCDRDEVKIAIPVEVDCARAKMAFVTFADQLLDEPAAADIVPDRKAKRSAVFGNGEI